MEGADLLNLIFIFSTFRQFCARLCAFAGGAGFSSASPYALLSLERSDSWIDRHQMFKAFKVSLPNLKEVRNWMRIKNLTEVNLLAYSNVLEGDER